MFILKCVLLFYLILRNECQLISEVNLKNRDIAFIEVSFDKCGIINISGLRLLILQEKSGKNLTISDIIRLDDISTNEHGLLTIGPVKNELYHQFKYDPELLHGLALLEYNDDDNYTETMEQFLSENP